MNRLIAVCKDSDYMAVAGMFLGVNTSIYATIKNKHSDWGSVMLGGCVGGLVGAVVPPAIPVYMASIPCYFVMEYLDKNELI